MGWQGLAQLASGNLGWAYFQLGDDEKALEQFLEAEKSATKLGNLRDELKWISDAGYVYHDTGDLTRATQSYRRRSIWQGRSIAKRTLRMRLRI